MSKFDEVQRLLVMATESLRMAENCARDGRPSVARESQAATALRSAADLLDIERLCACCHVTPTAEHRPICSACNKSFYPATRD